jgi:hypothetical protein
MPEIRSIELAGTRNLPARRPELGALLRRSLAPTTPL